MTCEAVDIGASEAGVISLRPFYFPPPYRRFLSQLLPAGTFRLAQDRLPERSVLDVARAHIIGNVTRGKTAKRYQFQFSCYQRMKVAGISGVDMISYK